MRAYLLSDPTSSIGSDELAKQGVLSWRIASEEPARTEMLEGIKRERGYVDTDFVALAPETPDLDTICAKFDREHFHTEDEARFVVGGDGIFDVRDADDRWMRIEVTEGDLIVIPANRHHRFYLTERKNIRCMRLFANHEGWAPLYRNA